MLAKAPLIVIVIYNILIYITPFIFPPNNFQLAGFFRQAFFITKMPMEEKETIMLVGSDNHGNLLIIVRPEDGTMYDEKIVVLDEKKQDQLKSFLLNPKTENHE